MLQQHSIVVLSPIKRQRVTLLLMISFPLWQRRRHWLLTGNISIRIFNCSYKEVKQEAFNNEAASGSLRVPHFSPGSWGFVHHEQHPCAAGVSVSMHSVVMYITRLIGLWSGPQSEGKRGLARACLS